MLIMCKPAPSSVRLQHSQRTQASCLQSPTTKSKMKACLVLVACMLAVIPATTGLIEAEIKKDLLEMGLPSNFLKLDTYERVTFETVLYIKKRKSNPECLCTSMHSTVVSSGEVWRGTTCPTVGATSHGFICQIDETDTQRWNPIQICNTHADCIADGQTCLAYGVVKKYCILTTQEARGTFCPCQQP